MKNTSYTFDKAPDFVRNTQIPWISPLWVDYNRLVNKP